MSVVSRPKLTPTAELRQLIAELSLVSHAPISAYGRQTPDSGEDIGGKRPPGSDAEYKPRAPKAPRRDGDAQSQKAWDEYEEDLAAWQACYHRRTPQYFERQLERCESEDRLRLLVDEARRTLEAWRRTPIPKGQEPEYGSPQWKRFVAESKEDAGTLASRYWNPTTGKNVTRRYINMIRQQYRNGA